MSKNICPGFSWDRVDFSFIMSGTMLCCGSRRKTMLIMQPMLLIRAAQSQGHFSFSYCPDGEGAEEHKELGGTEPGQLDKGLFHTISHHAKK